MLKRAILVGLLILGLSCSLFAGDLSPAAEAKLAALGRISHPIALTWRYHVGDLADGANPSLDDSSWPTQTGDAFQWGEPPLTWLRTKVTIPSEISGVNIAGSKITFTCGIDDDGIIYIDGKEAQQFHWDGCKVTLTENAQPGQTFDIAIKATNTGGPARLLCSSFDFSALSDLTSAVGSALGSYQRARTIYDGADEAKRAPYLPIMTKALEQIDTDALVAGKTEAFVASLKSSEAELGRVSELVRDIDINLVGHAHIDMDWLWLWPETVEVCKNTFTTMTRFMEQYPGFEFSQSQPRTYAAMAEYHPDLFEKMKAKIKSGQWDVSTAATWVEGDMNMASGEAIARQLLYGKRYIMQQFGIEPVVCWEPDTFGHAWTVPQILVKSGIKYYYNMRTGPDHPIFWWQSPDGSRVLAYHYDTYNGNIDENELLRLSASFVKKTGINEYMHVYGVGDHGGGPTEGMLNTAVALKQRTDYPTLKYSKASDYFDMIAKSKHDFPVWNNEMNFVFQGCYTSHSDAKRWNRECEKLLPTAETFAAIAGSTARYSYPSSILLDSWHMALFNQFHDIFDGSAIHGSYDYSSKLHDVVVSQADGAINDAIKAIAPQIATTGKGTPIVVFNRLSWTRTDVVSIPSPFPIGVSYAKVVDDAGRAECARIADGKLTFVARDVPATGYRVYWASKSGKMDTGRVTASGTTIENQFYRVAVDSTTGAIRSITDKSSGREVIAQGGSASLLQILLEGDHGGNAWDIAPYTGSEDLNKALSVSISRSDPSQATIAVEHSYDKSKFKQEISLYDGVSRIDIHLNCDWQQVCENKPTPLLKLAFQTNLKSPKATFEIPCGSIERPTDGAEVPGQKWIDLGEPTYGVSLLNNCKYGFDVKDNVMRSTVLRASSGPDPVPDKGVHDVTYSIYPHKGDWRAAGTVRRGYELNEPLVARVVTAHKGSLPSKKSYLSISQPNVTVTALKKAEDDNSLIVRFYETDGKPCRATVTVNLPARAVVETDILERPVGKPITLKNHQFTVNVGKCEIKTYKLLR